MLHPGRDQPMPGPGRATPSASRARRFAAVVLAVTLLTAGAACSTADDASPTTTVDPTAATTNTTSTTLLNVTTTVPGPARVNVADSPLGAILVDSDGMTLYAFAADPPGATSCVDTCAEAWPPLIATSVVTGTGLEAAAFTLTGRPADATGISASQVTVAGHPLYRFTGDSRSGETIGQGFNGQWFVVRPDGTPIQPTTATTLEN